MAIIIFSYEKKINVPDYIIKGGEKYKIITDHLGSIRYVVRVSDGAVVEEMEYDSFGNVLYDLNPGFIPFGFAGGIYDRDTGLVKFGARDYDPEAGRWTAKDPVLFNGNSSNLFEYVLNNPRNYSDKDGKFLVGAIIIIGVAAVITTSALIPEIFQEHILPEGTEFVHSGCSGPGCHLLDREPCFRNPARQRYHTDLPVFKQSPYEEVSAHDPNLGQPHIEPPEIFIPKPTR